MDKGSLAYMCVSNHHQLCACWPGDLGDTPLALLQGVLETCSVEKLAEIEDETRYIQKWTYCST